ncbi:MAG: exo-alpha-sialidase, partial [Candidatus Aminicenantales bacterium]
MCGFVALFNKDRTPADPALLSAMAETLAHRGPDGAGLLVEGPCGFAHKRLAVIDPEGGRQPMTVGPVTVVQSAAGAAKDGDAPPEVPGSDEWALTDGIIQPSVVSLRGNRLRLYARSTSKTGRICVADSADGGVRWTQARPIDLPNPNSGIDAATLPDGRVILVYNHTDRARTPLNLAVSGDGERFRMFRILEDAPGEYSYPAMVVAANGD